MEFYEILEELSNSANSKVCSAKDKQSGKMVIIKKLRRRGHSVREVNMNMRVNGTISHSSIVKMYHFFLMPEPTCNPVMVFEKCMCDLQQYNEDQPIGGELTQRWMTQLLQGLEFLHGMKIIHRDIKNQNLMITDDKCLKIGDFGISREWSDELMTPEMFSNWYRPIEIILQSRKYTTSADMWSAGCVMAEMYRRWPLFHADGEIMVLKKIVITLGKPTEENWPRINELEMGDHVTFHGPDEPKLREACQPALDLAVDLMLKLLTFDPEKRPTASEALNHPYFQQPDLCEVRQECNDPGFPN